MRIQMKIYLPVIITCIAALVMTPARAIFLQNLTITVTLMRPACIINDGQVINVKFDDNLLTTRIDGNSNKVLIDYRATNCPTRTLKLMIAGTPTTFDGDLLATSNADLGIKILNNASAQPLNSWKNFSGGVAPKLEAVLVKNEDKVLKSGPFTAVATLMIDYL